MQIATRDVALLRRLSQIAITDAAAAISHDVQTSFICSVCRKVKICLVVAWNVRLENAFCKVCLPVVLFGFSFIEMNRFSSPTVRSVAAVIELKNAQGTEQNDADADADDHELNRHTNSNDSVDNCGVEN